MTDKDKLHFKFECYVYLVKSFIYNNAKCSIYFNCWNFILEVGFLEENQLLTFYVVILSIGEVPPIRL